MGRKSRICEICGVKERQRPGFFANFPIDEQRCRHWVQIVGKEDLLYIPIEKLHEVRFICGDHFIPKDFNKKGNRLKKRAYPKLHLSALPLSETLMRDFPLHVASKTGPVPTSMESKAVPTRSRRPLATLTTQNIMETPAASTSTETLPTPWNHKILDTMDGDCRHIDHDHSYARVQHYDHTYARHPDTDENLETAATTCTESETVAAAPAASTSTEAVPQCPRKYQRPETVTAAPAASTSTEAVPSPRKCKRPATSCMESETAASPSTVPLLTTRTQKRSSATKDQLILQLRRAKATVKSLERNASLIDRIDSAMTVRKLLLIWQSSSPGLVRGSSTQPTPTWPWRLAYNPLDRHVTMRDVKWTCSTHFTKISVNKIDGYPDPYPYPTLYTRPRMQRLVPNVGKGEDLKPCSHQIRY